MIPFRHIPSRFGLLLLLTTGCQFEEASIPLRDDLPVVEDIDELSVDEKAPTDENIPDKDNPDEDLPLSPLVLVEAPFVEEVDASTVFIHFHVSDFSHANLEYGATPLLDQETTREESFNFAEHRQRIQNLSSGVEYNYRVLATDQENNELVSDVFSFIKE